MMRDGNLDAIPSDDAGAMLPAASSRSHVPALAPVPNQAISLDLRSPDAAAKADEIDLISYWRILVKRKWTVLGVLGIVLATALVATLLMTPIYRATATMQIDRETMQVVEVKGMGQSAVEGYGANDFYQTQYELLKSRALAARVVNQLGLAESPDGVPAQRRSPWARLRGLLSGGDAPKAGGPPTEARKRAAVAAFQSGVTIEPVRNSRLVLIHYDSPDPAFAVRAANGLAEGFMASNLEHGFESSAYAKSYLEDRLQELKLKLEDSERKLVAFAQKEQIISSGGDTGTLTEQDLGSINTALSKAKEERIRLESRWRQASAARGTALPADMLENSSIRPLQEARSKLMVEYQDKLRLFKPNYPTMVQLKGQIDELDKQIGAEVANIKASIRAEYVAAQGQEAMLAAQLGGLKTDVLDLQGRSIQYNIFKREVDTNRQLYDGLLQRYKEIGVAGGVTTNNISIVDRADGAGKFKPSLVNNMLIALLAGAILGVLLALGFEYLDDTIKAPEDIEKQLGLSVLGVIPKLKPPLTPDSALEDPRSAFAEAYRSVRTALQFATDEGVPRCLLVTSATPSEGKSTTALTLAKNFAQLGKRVLIIDGDLRNPSLHRTLGLHNTTGLSNYLAGASKANDALQQTGVPHLTFMSSGPLPPNPAELLVGHKLLSLLTVAVEKFDQVIIDGPPVRGLADAAILGNVCAGTLLIVRAGETRNATARNALKRLLSARARVVGALLTQYTAGHAAGYGYGDYSYYQYGGKETAKLTRQ
jgi:capsular exopolysaccharide synthesis family protein